MAPLCTIRRAGREPHGRSGERRDRARLRPRDRAPDTPPVAHPGLAVLPARLVDAALPISGSLVATDLVRHTTSTATYHPLLRHPAAPPVRMDLGDQVSESSTSSPRSTRS